MRVSLIKSGKIKNFILSNTIQGNYWLSDIDKNGNDRNLINIEASDNSWKMISNNEVQIIKNNIILNNQTLKEFNFYTIRDLINNQNMIVYCSPICDENISYYDVSSYLNRDFTIGKTGCDLNYNFPAISNVCAKINFNNEKIIIYDNDFQYGIYVNNTRINKSYELEYGDVIFILGLKISVILYKNIPFLMVNNPNGLVACSIMSQNLIENTNEFVENTDDIEMELYDVNDYFHKKPRFIYTIDELQVNVDAPPEKATSDDTPALLTIGPMLTMSMMSMTTMISAVSNISNGATWSSVIPSLVMGGAMLGSTLVWPIITKKYQKNKKKNDEKLRQEKYSKYIDDKYDKIVAEKTSQSSTLNNKYISLAECEKVILNKQVNLWERRKDDEDFLSVCLGYGTLPMKVNIRYPEEHFSLASDNLKDMVNKLGSEPKILNDVPIPFYIKDNFITGVIGEYENSIRFINNLVLQLVAFHSYDDLKIVVLTNDDNIGNWEYMKVLPHTFSNDCSIRFIAANSDEYKEVSYNLERVIYNRLGSENNSFNRNINIDEHYLIITDSFKHIRNFDAIKKILQTKEYIGFSMIMINDKMSSLPDQCQAFINVREKQSEMFKNTSNNETQKFEIDYTTNYNIYECAKVLANVPIEIDSETGGNITEKLGFLEMYDVGKVEQLNSLNRWIKNTPILNMQAPVGVGKSGETIYLDLHEKYHGPHGLIAGMTGSGKSEFIITYILSMAVNYHPYEVQFILIDYKGGGLAGAFENKKTGVKLPHLVGTITNLDVNEIKRAIASIDSEIKRRQRLFNEARDLTGESTIDIYKYQKMFREHQVAEPVSHLFIIADEFAEMKTQQSEFMENLISIARIGRSLGIHLILATQKPSGVVDSQIWSNTRFRVCLKVQDKGDSSEVIKCPDAALLKQTGRFYLQVGFNEVFVLGQSAWSGGKYIPTEKIKKEIDTSIEVLDNIGYTIKKVDNKVKRDTSGIKSEELGSILKYLHDIAKSQNIKCRKLWLDKISEFIKIDELAQKYNYKTEPFEVNPIIGEFDVPSEQEQYLLTLPLKNGNTIIYGSTGSGKENFLTTMIYSSMLFNSVHEVNYYIVDCGSGVLKYFNNSPLVGDIINIDEDDKLQKLFSILNDEIDKRKGLFSEYNGEYSYYCKNSGNKLPAIVIMINNYEAFQETYPDYEEVMNVMIRDSIRYGIYFIVTVTNPNGLRFRIKQNFNQVFVLCQNNDEDFITILGNVHKNYPSKNFGRGIFKVDDNVYEFQTALVDERENISNIIKQKSAEMDHSVVASKIPTLPSVVSYYDIVDYAQDKVIIGIDKNTLEYVSYEFEKNFISPIVGVDNENSNVMMNNLAYQLNNNTRYNTIIINAEDFEIDDKVKEGCQYIDNNFNTIFESLYNFTSKNNAAYVANNYDNSIFSNVKHTMCIIAGLDGFKNKLNADNKKNFDQLFEKGKDMEIISYIIVDSIDSFKKFEFDSWYKNCFSNTDAIWIGNGINDQFTIKLSQKTKETKENVPPGFCLVLKKGVPTLVKYVQTYLKDE